METDEVSPTEDGLTYAHRRLFARQIESMSLPTNIDLPTSPWVARVGVVTLRVAWVAMLNLTPTQHTASVSASVKTQRARLREATRSSCACALGFSRLEDRGPC